MAQILTSLQMKALEAAAIASGKVTGLALMERAGHAAGEAILQEWPQAQEALVLCGPGNNGGDGYVIARFLAEHGWNITLCATRPADRLPPDAATAAGRAAAAGIEPRPFSTADIVSALSARSGACVVVDALLGIGQERDCSELLRPWTEALARIAAMGCNIHTMSVDIPTGYFSDREASCAQVPFAADLIVTFHSEKPVHRLLRRLGAKIIIADIGLPYASGPAEA